MDFDFYLKVLKHRFHYDADYTNLNIVFSDINFNLKKENESVIAITTPEVQLSIASGEYLLKTCSSEFFQDHINLANQSRVVIVLTHMP